MNYILMKDEEIEKAKYPNLLAEIKWSGYSTSTIAGFMGLGAKKGGKYRPEGDPEVWDKLTGKKEISIAEAEGLVRYYNVTFTYLFAHELCVIDGKAKAYWRWYEENQKKHEEIARSKAIMDIYEELVRNPELLEFMKWCKTLSEEQRKEVIRYLQASGGEVNA